MLLDVELAGIIGASRPAACSVILEISMTLGVRRVCASVWSPRRAPVGLRVVWTFVSTHVLHGVEASSGTWVRARDRLLRRRIVGVPPVEGRGIPVQQRLLREGLSRRCSLRGRIGLGRAVQDLLVRHWPSVVCLVLRVPGVVLAGHDQGSGLVVVDGAADGHLAKIFSLPLRSHSLA